MDTDLYGLNASEPGKTPAEKPEEAEKSKVVETPKETVPEARACFIDDLDWWVSDEDILGLLDMQDELVLNEISFLEHKHNAKSRGSCFVLFTTAEACLKAVKKLEDAEINGKKVSMRVAPASVVSSPYREGRTYRKTAQDQPKMQKRSGFTQRDSRDYSRKEKSRNGSDADHRDHREHRDHRDNRDSRRDLDKRLDSRESSRSGIRDSRRSPSRDRRKRSRSRSIDRRNIRDSRYRERSRDRYDRHDRHERRERYERPERNERDYKSRDYRRSDNRDDKYTKRSEAKRETDSKRSSLSRPASESRRNSESRKSPLSPKTANKQDPYDKIPDIDEREPVAIYSDDEY